MSRTTDGTFGVAKNQPPTQTRPYDFGTDAIERQRVSLGQALIDADFEYGLQATKWQTSQELRKNASMYEIAGTEIPLVSVSVSGYGGSNVVTVTTVSALPQQLIVGSIISIFGLSNAQRNADRAEGYFLVQSVPTTTTFTYSTKGPIGSLTGVTYPQVISTSYTYLRRGGIYTNGNARLGFSSVSTDGLSNVTVSFPSPHGLSIGTPIQTSMQSFANLSGSFTVTSIPSPNVFIFSNTSPVGPASSYTVPQITAGSITNSGTLLNTAAYSITSNIGIITVGCQVPMAIITGAVPGTGSAVITSLTGSGPYTGSLVFSTPQTFSALPFSATPALCVANVNAVGVSGFWSNIAGAALTLSNINVIQGGLYPGQTVSNVSFGGTIAGTGTVSTIANSPFTVVINGITPGGTGTLNNATFTAPSGTTSNNNVIYTSPYSYAQHRPLDGGVLISPNHPSQGASMTRQTKKVFRYQSGKGILFSTGTLFCPINDVTFVTAAPPATPGYVRIVCDVPHGGPQPGATINLRGIASSGYNGNYIVQKIIDSKTIEVFPLTSSPLVSPAVFQDQPRYCMSNWQCSSVRAGIFDDQNGMFWEYDGQNLWNVRRSSSFQLAGYVYIQPGSQVMYGDSDTSVYLNSNVFMGTFANAASSVTGTYTASLGVTYTIGASSNVVNNGQLIPVSAFTGITPGANTYILSASYPVISGTTTTLTNVIPQGPLVATASQTTATQLPVSAFPNMNGTSIPYISACTYLGNQTYTATVTFSTAPYPAYNATNIAAISGTTYVTTSAAHYMTPGVSVTLAGGNSGTFKVLTVPTTTTFTFSNAATAITSNVQIASTSISPTTVTLVSAVPHGLSNNSSIFTAATGTSIANGTFTATVVDSLTLTYPITPSVPTGGSSAYRFTPTAFSNVNFTTPYTSFNSTGSSQIITGASYTASGTVTQINLTGTGTTLTVGYTVAGFGGSPNPGVVTVSSAGSATVTFPASFTASGSSIGSTTFYPPYVVTAPNKLQVNSQLTISGTSGGTISLTGGYVSPVGLSSTSFQYGTGAAILLPTGGTALVQPFLVQTTGTHSIIPGSTLTPGSITVARTGGDGSYAYSSGATVVDSQTILYNTSAAPINGPPTSGYLQYAGVSATTPFFSTLGSGYSATFISTGISIFVVGSTLPYFAITPSGGVGFGQSGTSVTVASSSTITYTTSPVTATTGTVNAGSTLIAVTTATVNPVAGSLTNVLTYMPSTNTGGSLASAAWSAGTYSAFSNVVLTFTATSSLVVGSSIAVSAFGANGGYAYISAAASGSITTANVVFSQSQTLAAATGKTLNFDTNPTSTLADCCDLGFLTVSNVTATTFTALSPVPQTVSAGTFTTQAFQNQLTLSSQVMPFSPDPIPIGTASLQYVCSSNITPNVSGNLYPSMQTTTTPGVFGANIYVASSLTTANSFTLNFVPLQSSVSKASILGLGNQTFAYPNTRFIDQLKVNDKVVLRGMTHTVVQIQSQGTMIVNPPYRGVSAISVPIKLCKVRETRVHQSQFNRDTFDGKGPSGFVFDPTKMQMLGIQYTWYGAGFIDYMMRGGDGNWLFANRIRNNNVNDEAHMRSGNLPARYEVVNEAFANQTTLASSMGFTDTVLTTVDPLTYWPPTGQILIDNELVTYTGKSTYQLTGLTRAATLTYNINDAPFTLQNSNTAQQHNIGSSVNLFGVTCVPSLTHWGSSFIIDGGFDFDRGYYFNYQTQGTGTFTSGNTYPLFMLRLSPSVSNSVIGDIGARDLLNRAQLLLQRMDVFASNVNATVSTGSFVGAGSVVFSGVLNPQGVTGQNWTPINSVANGSAPSFAQVSTVSGQYISGSGERVFSTICNAGSQNSIDLSTLKEVCNAVIGGNGIFPDGPDTLLVYMLVPAGFPNIQEYSVNLFWSEAQA